MRRRMRRSLRRKSRARAHDAAQLQLHGLQSRPERRSTGARRGPARGRSARGRRGAARSSPSGRARGTGRSGRSSGGATRTRRRRAPPGSTPEDRADRLRAVASERELARVARRELPRSAATVFVSCASALLRVCELELRLRSLRGRAEQRAGGSRRSGSCRGTCRSAATLCSSRSSSVTCRVAAAFALPARLDVLLLAAAAACVTSTNAHRPTSRAFRLPPGRGQGRGPHGGRSCLSIRRPYPKAPRAGRECLQNAKKTCHERNRA